MTKGRITLAVCTVCFLIAAALRWFELPGEPVIVSLCMSFLAAIWVIAPVLRALFAER